MNKLLKIEGKQISIDPARLIDGYKLKCNRCGEITELTNFKIFRNKNKSYWLVSHTCIDCIYKAQKEKRTAKGIGDRYYKPRKIINGLEHYQCSGCKKFKLKIDFPKLNSKRSCCKIYPLCRDCVKIKNKQNYNYQKKGRNAKPTAMERGKVKTLLWRMNNGY